MKKTLALLLAAMITICFGGAVTAYAADAEENTENDEKIIDMYLIGGQSNAAGCSTAGDPPSEIFNNIMYAGQTDRMMSNGATSSSLLTYSSFKKAVSFGLGYRTNAMGPEYGMASVLDESYANSDKDAIIFKSATGGTTLCDYADGACTEYGNWYPRSLWEEGYTPSLELGNTDPTGVLYALFLENFKTVYNELVNNGYTPVVKGMVWMQGESDMWQLYSYSGGYGELLKIFITDIREDLAKITGDESLYEMPFIIGKIPTTSVVYNNPDAYAINEMQQKAADALDGVATIETSDLIIVKEDGTNKGADQYHFHLEDMEILGKRFGEALLNMPASTDTKATVTVENDDSQGEVYTRFNLTQLIGTEITFYITPAEGYRIASVTFNGAEIEAESEGKYKIIMVEGDNLLKVEYGEAEASDDAPQQPDKPSTPSEDAPDNDQDNTSADKEEGFFDKIAAFFSSVFSAIADFFAQLFGKK